MTPVHSTALGRTYPNGRQWGHHCAVVHFHACPVTSDAHTDDGLPNGWVKPQRRPSLTELEELIADKRSELAELERQARELRAERRMQALAQARNIMRAHGLTVADLQA